MKFLQFILVLILFGSCTKTGQKQEATKSKTSTSVPVNNDDVSQATALKIGFVLSDTLLNKYNHYQKIKKNLTAKGQKIENEIESRTKAMQIEYQGYQAKGQSMSPKELQAAEASLMKKQQDLETYKNQKAAELMKEEESLNKDLQKRIDNYLEEYASKNGYTFILSKHIGGSVLFGVKSLDITNEVIEGLNAKDKIK